ncbi:MAG: 3-phosphoshikimate 1-carboxyvinyltransferase [Gammaproteobacteria bacterium]|nr:3-phosphoshikimate 1-carboxyvinyltransferase [Gammaproteobacteria bacterium]
MKKLSLKPVKYVSGEVQLPGSKSLSNRALLLAALSRDTTRIRNLLNADDVQHMVYALSTLGIDIQWDREARECVVSGVGKAFQGTNQLLRLNLGNAGTAIRPLTAALCLAKGDFIVDGDAQMRERPIGHLVDALRHLGADIKCMENEGYPPLYIKGGSLKGGRTSLPGNISSQYLTALLLSLPLCENDCELTVIGDQVSKPYLAMTLDIMARFGVSAEHQDFQHFSISGNQQYQSPGEYWVEGDASSASYFLAAAAIKGGTVRVHGIGKDSVQGDVDFTNVLSAMGAQVKMSDNWVEVTRGSLKGVDMDLNAIPDAAMTIATTALFAEGKTTIRNIYNWRVKETDRMTAMANELRKLGASVETGEDFISIVPPEYIQPAEISTYNDHRIAMAFSLAALGNTEIVILDPDCTSKTFPEYFDLFHQICQ